MRSPNVRGIASLALLLVVVVGCSSDDRPDAAIWLRSWNAIVSIVPEQADIGDPPDQSMCQNTLAAIRERSDGLLPTPSATVDGLAQEWVSIAETAFFECPPEEDGLETFDAVYDELRRVEESVQTSLSN